MKSIHEKYWVHVSPHRDPFYEAQEEHAFLLRCEGLTNKEVSARVSGYIPMKLFRIAHRLNRAMRHTKFWMEV